MLRLIFRRLIQILIVLLAIPTIAILLTWNALPSHAFYPAKLQLEAVAEVVVSPSYTASSALEISLVNRRLKETQQVFASDSKSEPSSVPLENLIRQAKSAKTKVSNTNNSKSKSKSTSNLVKTLNQANQALEQQKQVVISKSTLTLPPTDQQNHPTTQTKDTPDPTPPIPNIKKPAPDHQTPTPSSKPLPTSTPSPFPQPTPTPQSVVPTIDETPNIVVEQIEDTQEELKSIIKELQTPGTTTNTTTPNQPSTTIDKTVIPKKEKLPEQSKPSPQANDPKQQSTTKKDELD